MPWAKEAGKDNRRTVDLEWRGSDAVRITIPARVEYHPGPQAQASVSGDAELISHVRLRDGTLEWDAVDGCFPADDLVVQLSGPAVQVWTLNGSGQLTLTDLKQDTLHIAVYGSGTVAASGEARETLLDAAGSGRADLNIKQEVLRITTHGSGAIVASGEARDVSLHATGSSRADLGRLVAQQVSARISGSGDVDLAPRQDADIAISGSGVVRLHGTVARIQSHVSGSGKIQQVP